MHVSTAEDKGISRIETGNDMRDWLQRNGRAPSQELAAAEQRRITQHWRAATIHLLSLQQGDDVRARKSAMAAVAAFLAVGTHQSVTKDDGVLGKMLTVANAVK